MVAVSISVDGLTMAMFMPELPAALARNMAWMASLTKLLPRKEKDRLLRPPLTPAPGRFWRIQRAARMKSSP